MQNVIQLGQERYVLGDDGNYRLLRPDGTLDPNGIPAGVMPAQRPSVLQNLQRGVDRAFQGDPAGNLEHGILKANESTQRFFGPPPASHVAPMQSLAMANMAQGPPLPPIMQSVPMAQNAVGVQDYGPFGPPPQPQKQYTKDDMVSPDGLQLPGNSTYAQGTARVSNDFDPQGYNPFSLEAYGLSGASQRGVPYDAWMRQQLAGRLPQRPQHAATGAPPAASIPEQTGNPSQDLFDVLVEAGRMDEAFRTSPELFRQQFHEDGTPRGSMGPSDFDKRQKLGGLSEGFLRDVPTAEDARRQKQEAWEAENANLRNTDSSFEKKNWVAPYGVSRKQAAKEYATRMRIYDEAARRGESPEVLAKLHPGIMVGGLQNGDVMTPQQMDVRRKDSLDRQKELWANMRASGLDTKTRLATATKRMNAMRDGYSRGDAERIAGGELPLADFLATQEADAERANQAKIAETMANAEALKMMLEQSGQTAQLNALSDKTRQERIDNWAAQGKTPEEAAMIVDSTSQPSEPTRKTPVPSGGSVPPPTLPSVPVPSKATGRTTQSGAPMSDEQLVGALLSAGATRGITRQSIQEAIAEHDRGNPKPLEQFLGLTTDPAVKDALSWRLFNSKAAPQPFPGLFSLPWAWKERLLNDSHPERLFKHIYNNYIQ